VEYRKVSVTHTVSVNKTVKRKEEKQEER